MYNLEDYEDVQSRVERFKKLHPVGRIVTDVIQFDSEKGHVLIAAQIYREYEDTLPTAVDYAFGARDSYNPNMRRFYVEDTVSSAIGRALALVLPDTNKKPTKQDMVKVGENKNQAHTPKVERLEAKSINVENPQDPWTVKEKPMPVEAKDAVELVKEVLGGTEIKPVAPMCKCSNEMVWREGVSKGGKPWGHFRCPRSWQAKWCQEPIWYEITSNGTWKPRQVA